MLRICNISDYRQEYNPTWAFSVSDECLPTEVMVPSNHPFFRLARHSSLYDKDDFKTYAEKDPFRCWGKQLPLAVGLSLIDNEAKARRNLKLPVFRQFQGIIALTLNPEDGVVKQTGVHRSHYTWWRTTAFQMSNLTMLKL